MKRFFILCLVTVLGTSLCHADEVIVTQESGVEEVERGKGCPCSKACRCAKTCRCYSTGCRGCCDQNKTKADGACVAALCDCDEGCRCS